MKILQPTITFEFKKLSVLLVVTILSFQFSYSQKLTYDQEILSDVIIAKQEEVKNRFFRNLVSKNIRTSNQTSYAAAYNFINIVTTEKNKTLISKNLMTLVAEYAATYAVAEIFIQKNQVLFPISNDGVPGYITNYVDSTGIKRLSKKVIKSYRPDSTFFSNQQYGIENLLVNKEVNKNFDKSTFSKYEKRKNNKYGIVKGQYLGAIVDVVTESLHENEYFNKKGLFVKQSWRAEMKLLEDQKNIEKLKLNKVTKDSIRNFVKTINSKNLSTFLGKDFNNPNAIQINIDSLVRDIKSFNLNKMQILDKNSVDVVLKYFKWAISLYENKYGENNYLSVIGEVISEYIITDIAINDKDQEVYKFKVDIEAIILSLEDEFYDGIQFVSIKTNSFGIEPFFTLGFNYGLVNGATTILDQDGVDKFKQLGYGGERIGLKFVFIDSGEFRNKRVGKPFLYKGREYKHDIPKSDPLVHKLNLSIYGSGILYNIVDLKSDNAFNFGMLGTALSLEFFNGLEISIFASIPLISGKNSFANSIFGVGTDIPIFDYLREARSRRNR